MHEVLKEYGHPHSIDTTFNKTLVRVKHIIRIDSHNINYINIYVTKVKYQVIINELQKQEADMHL